MDRFLAVHAMPDVREEGRGVLERVAQAAGHRGVRAVESLVSPERAAAFSLFEAKDATDVAEVLIEAGIPAAEVFPVERVYTGLLDES